MARRAKGTGYLIENPDGTKTLRMTVYNPKTNKDKRIQVTAANETACNRLMKARLKELENMEKLLFSDSRLTVVQLCRNHLNNQYEQKLIKRTSRDRNEVTIHNQIEPYAIGHMQIGTITTRDIETYFSKLFALEKGSASTIEKAKFILDSAFKWAVARGDLRQNPIDPIRIALKNRFVALKEKTADDEDVRIMTSVEKEKALEVALSKWSNGSYKYTGGIHYRFLLNTGLRVGEYIALRWEDYDFENHILRINKNRHVVKAAEGESERKYIALEGTTKNYKARNIELNPEAIKVIEEIYKLTPWKHSKDYICLTRTKKNYTATSMEHIVHAVYKNAGISDNISGLHVLRRTFATQLFDEGYTVKEIAAYLGDEEATVSRYYIAARTTKEIAGKRIAVVSLNKNRI